ncbi:ATP-binding protein [Bariatricus sp. HCP28S3_D3]|uniref:ATP-binding protein n=1 Tax=Bariatricus sp. HCP28S3_D3 TaxID=3438901 RepID=UPI003F89F26D
MWHYGWEDKITCRTYKTHLPDGTAIRYSFRQGGSVFPCSWSFQAVIYTTKTFCNFMPKRLAKNKLLAKCDWIDEPNNLLMTGGAGAGKTHIACALCITAMHQNRTVKYIRANTLLKESDHARQEGTYFEYSNEMAAYDLMVIDDFGLMDLDIEKCRDLFEIIESRDCRKATIIISQIPVSGGYQLFGDSTYADACLSRMTSKAYRLEFPGRDRRITNSN